MNTRFAYISFWICIAACAGDIIVTTIAGSNYPGYSQLSNTLSQLGSDISPVSGLMSTWWTILGLTFVLLGYTIKRSFLKPRRPIKVAFWLFAGYGIGEGICSGVFPVNYNSEGFDFISILHIVLSGIGVLSILLLPIALQKAFTKRDHPLFYNYSFLTIILGLLFIGLFTLSKSIDNPDNFFVVYKGLWQRALTLNFYAYFLILTATLVRLSSNKLYVNQE